MLVKARISKRPSLALCASERRDKLGDDIRLRANYIRNRMYGVAKMFGLGKLFGRQNSVSRANVALYEQITQQALHPWFYTVVGVKETFTGKFDLSVLHAHLLIERLRRDPATPKGFTQSLFDTLFSNWDFALRETGVGDMSVRKHMKRLMQGFYGRAQTFTAAIETGDQAELEQALKTNLGLDQATPEQIRHMQSYVVELNQYFTNEPLESFLSGELSIPDPASLAQRSGVTE